jgi:hypothetical protein
VATNTDDVLNDELQAQMSGVKDRAHGWIGSKYVGVDAAMGGTAVPKPTAAPGSLPPPPQVTGSQGKLPGEWEGSRYVGPAKPAAPAPAAPPSNAPAPPVSHTMDAAPPTNAPAPPAPPPGTPPRVPQRGDPDYIHNYGPDQQPGTADDVQQPGVTPTPRPPAPPAVPPLTREQYDALTPAQRRDYFAGKINADGSPKTAPAQLPPGEQPASDFGGGDVAQQNRQLQDAKNAPAPQGFDANKWRTGTPDHDSHKYVGGEILAAGGNRAAILANPKFAGWKAGDGPDLVVSPEGSVYDIWYDFGGPNQRPQWQYKGGGPAGPRNDGIVGNDPNGGAAAAARARLHDGIPGNAAGGTTAVTDTFGAGGAGAGGAGGGDYPFPNDPAVDDAITRLLGRGEAPVTRASVDDQYSPVAAVIQRNAERQQAQAAERATFQGTNIGGAGGSLDAEGQQINEAAGMQQGQLMASLITGELTQRRADVVNAINFAQGDQKMRLQAQLAALDRELERQRLAQQNQQYYDDLGFRIGDREMYYNDRESDRL